MIHLYPMTMTTMMVRHNRFLNHNIGHFFCCAVCIDDHAETLSPKQRRAEEKRIRNKVLESNFRYPAPKSHADFIAVPNNVSEARAEELKEQWVENAYHPSIFKDTKPKVARADGAPDFHAAYHRNRMCDHFIVFVVDCT